MEVSASADLFLCQFAVGKGHVCLDSIRLEELRSSVLVEVVRLGDEGPLEGVLVDQERVIGVEV